MTFIASLLLVEIGCLCVFAKDFVWDLSQFSPEVRGVTSERTARWDTTTTIDDVLAILVSIAGIVSAFTHG